MAQPRKIKPEKAVVGFIYSSPADRDAALARLTEKLGPVDLVSDEMEFDQTDYYAGEMGTGLKRMFVSFERIIDPGELPGIKLFTNEVEKGFTDASGNRRINIDPGTLSLAKLVLASAKNFSHRVYMGQGIWGEVTLQYHGSDFDTLPWTFKEFGDRRHKDFFLGVRAVYERQIKALERP